MRQTILTLFILALISSLGMSQVSVGAFGEMIVEQSAPIPEITTISKENIVNGPNNKAEVKRGLKKTKKKNEGEYRYMSFKIEIMTVESTLDLDNHIFSSYGDISFNQTKKDGFTYFSGDFSDENQAKRALEKVQRVYPKARIVKERRYLNKKKK